MEVLTTERTYLEQLSQLVSCYEDPLVAAGVLGPMDKRIVFINVRVLLQIHQELLESLKAKMESENSPGQNFALGAALLSISPLLTFYKDYVNKYHDGGEHLRRLNENKKFAQVLAKCKHANSSGGLNSLENLLVVPVQRIPRYVLLLREVLRFTPESHPDFPACTQALEKLERVGQLINDARRQFENGSRFLQMAKRTDVPLIEAHRQMLEEYRDVLVRTSKLDSPGELGPFEKRTVLIMTDSLVVLRPDVDVAGERFVFIDLVSFDDQGGAVLEENVGENLFSICNMKAKKLLHTIRAADDRQLRTMLDSIKVAIVKWREDARLFAQEAKELEKLSGLTFSITGTVPVAPPNGKPYVMYMISMRKDKEDPNVILKQYSELLALHKRMVQIYGEAALPKFPPKKISGGEKGSSQRELMLQEYLNGLVKQREILKVPEVRRFLMSSASTDATPSKSPRLSANNSASKSPRSSGLNRSGMLSTRKSPRLSRDAAAKLSDKNLSSDALDVVAVFAADNVQDLTHEGWLTKKGHKRRNWKRRWMVLRDGEISYYAKKGASEPKGVIDLLLPGVSVIFMENSPASSFRFMIITPDQIFPMYADTAEDRKGWMDVIEKVVAVMEDQDEKSAPSEGAVPVRKNGEEEVLVWTSEEGSRNSNCPSYIY